MQFSRYSLYVHSAKLALRSLRFVNRLALSSICAFRLVLAKLLSASGDGEIRTLDPLLARQVLLPTELHPHINLASTCSPMPSPA